MADFIKSTELGFVPVNNVISILKTSFQILTVGVALIALFGLVQITQNLRDDNSRPQEKRVQNAMPKKALEVSQIR